MNYYSFDEILNKCKNYCSKKETCKADIKNKFFQWKINFEYFDDVIEELEDERYIDEQRFAESFTKDKIRFNKWGLTKIRNELKMRDISTDSIESAFEKIDFEEYYQIIENEVNKKAKALKNIDKKQKKSKIINFSLQRGYELDLSLKIINGIINNE